MTQYQSEDRSIADPLQAGLQAIAVNEARRGHARRINRHGLDSGNEAAGLSTERGNEAGLEPAPSEATLVRRVGIIGANATGIGMAGSLLAADIPVTLFEPARDALDRATAAMRSGFRNSVAEGELTASQCDRRVALLAGTVNLHHLKDCDVIVDALGTDPDVKEALVRRLNEVARPDAVLLACAPGVDVDRIAAWARYPANVLGIRLPEGGSTAQWRLVPGKDTSKAALATAGGIVRQLCGPALAALPPALPPALS